MERRSFVALGSLLLSQAHGAVYTPKALSVEDFALGEEYLEMLLPGSKAAFTMRYIDLGLAHGIGGMSGWQRGLAAVRDAGFTSQSTELMRGWAKVELKPATETQRFFATAKRAAIEAYALSEAGKKEWLGYKGGMFLEKFSGCEHDSSGKAH